MKHYRSITNEILNPNSQVFVQSKLDGRNFTSEFNKKQGFYKFGSRHQLVGREDPIYSKAITILEEKYSEPLTKIFKDNKWDNVNCFFEFYGPNSFAGNIDLNDDLTITLIDINPYKQGILNPADFIKHFQHLDIPKVHHIGRITEEFIQSVKNSTLKDMAFEGVVCKAAPDNPKTKEPIMFKIKSNAWLEKLKLYCNGDIELFKKLM